MVNDVMVCKSHWIKAPRNWDNHCTISEYATYFRIKGPEYNPKEPHEHQIRDSENKSKDLIITKSKWSPFEQIVTI